MEREDFERDPEAYARKRREARGRALEMEAAMDADRGRGGDRYGGSRHHP